MRVAVEIPYSLADAIRELGGDGAGSSNEVITIETEDRMFVGGGCEAPSVGEPGGAEINVSVCALRERKSAPVTKLT